MGVVSLRQWQSPGFGFEGGFDGVFDAVGEVAEEVLADGGFQVVDAHQEVAPSGRPRAGVFVGGEDAKGFVLAVFQAEGGAVEVAREEEVFVAPRAKFPKSACGVR